MMNIKLLVAGLLIVFFSEYLYSQFYYFGRNKVQYEKFDWKVLKTEHFDVYYYNETEKIAEIGAAYAEEAYLEYKVKFNHVVNKKIPLIFYNTSLHFQQTNTTPGFIPEGVGGFFEFMKGRVVIPHMGSLGDFRHVIRHELVHVFMTTKVYRILQDHRMSTDIMPPLWFVEGLAEFLSTDIDAQAEMVMRDAMLNDYFVNISNMYQIYGSFLMYKEGQSFLEYVKHKYGQERVLQMVDNIWMYDGYFEQIIEYTLGEKLSKIEADWEYYLKQKYFPLLAGSSPPGVYSEKITYEGFNFAPGYFQDAGSGYIYFNANRNGYSSLYRLKSEERRFSDDDDYYDIEEPEMLIQGETSEEFEAFHLFQSGIDVSKDGLVAFVTKSGATDAIHLYSSAEEEVITKIQNSSLVSISSPKFSRDSKLIVFNAVDHKGYSDVFIYDTESKNFKRLTDDYYDDRDPCFGRDNEVIFSSDRTGGEYERKYNIFSYNLNDNRIRYVTYLNCNNYTPVMNPSGDRLLFSSDYDGVRNIWMIEFNGNDYEDSVYQVTSLLTSSFNPSFKSNDEILYTGFENFSFNIYSYNLNQNHPRRSIQMDFMETTPDWYPPEIATAGAKEEYNYEKEYTLDFAQSEVTTDPVYGTRAGAMFSLSDLLGDDRYFFLIYNTAESQSELLTSFNIILQKLNMRERANYGYGVFHLSGRRYDISESDEYFYERSYGGFLQLQFPLSKFDRITTSVALSNSDKELLAGLVERKALLLSNTISYVHDNSLWGPSGPLAGSRGMILLGYTSDIKYSNVNYLTVMADYRHYLRLGLRTALAVRGALFYNEGKEARRYFMGGSWDLRGYPRWSIRGEKMWFSSLEFRFPLIDELQLRFPFIDLGFFGLRGAFFFDAGSAWDVKYQDTFGAVGVGIRFNLFGVMVMRYDIGKKIENNFSTFQDDLFFQFFFGWDF